LTSAAAVVKLTDMPLWQAANPRPKAMWVLPVPLKDDDKLDVKDRPVVSQG
jgi:hypothetical protein